MISKTALLTIAVSICCSAPVFAQAGSVQNGLPPTSMDSFVHEAAGNAENIYGDEGFQGPPPFEYFEYINRINSGITGVRDQGITTGHGSMMPDAWGRDEFLGQEWSMSGANGGNPQNQGAGYQADVNGNTPAGYQAPAGGTPLYDPATGQLMGYAAPGETYQQFFSGSSGHIFPQFTGVGEQIIQKGGLPSGPIIPGSTPNASTTTPSLPPATGMPTAVPQ